MNMMSRTFPVSASPASTLISDQTLAAEDLVVAPTRTTNGSNGGVWPGRSRGPDPRRTRLACQPCSLAGCVGRRLRRRASGPECRSGSCRATRYLIRRRRRCCRRFNECCCAARSPRNRSQRRRHCAVRRRKRNTPLPISWPSLASQFSASARARGHLNQS